jgi:hypothetical protein
MSPYDIPESYRGYYCPQKRKFVVEFRYLGEEPLVSRSVNEHLDVEEGSNTGRLYRMLVDVDALNASSIEVLLNNAQILPPPNKKNPNMGFDRSSLNHSIIGAVKDNLQRLVTAG